MSGALGSIARIGLTAAGYYFGGPLGAFVGSTAGSLLFPEKLPGAEGPRLGPDQGMTAASIGVGIPILFGTIDVNGIVIQDLGRVEHEETEGGKGASSQEVTTYSYTRTYAVLLADCSGDRPIAGILRIWRNAKLVMDLRPQQPGEEDDDYTVRQAATLGFLDKCAIYLGTDDQLPDPVLEAAVGVGLQPAYRHRAYIVLYDEDVTDNGGRTSQWKFEVNGTFSNSTVIEYTVGMLYPWLVEVDPRNPLNQHLYRNYLAPADPYATSQADAIVAMLAEGGDPAAGEPYTSAQYTNLIGWSLRASPDGDAVRVMYPAGAPDGAEDRAWLGLHFNQVLPSHPTLTYEIVLDDGVGGGIVCRNMLANAVSVGSGNFWWAGYQAIGDIDTASYQFGMFELRDFDAGSESGQLLVNNCINYPPDEGAHFPRAGLYYDGLLEAVRYPSAPTNPCDGRPALPENPDFCVLSDGSVIKDQPWVYTAGSFKYLRGYVIATGSEGLGYVAGEIISTPLGPVLPVGHANDTMAFWQAARDAAILAGESIPSTFDAQGDGNRRLTYPVLEDHAYTRTLESSEGVPLPVTLASIVTEICRRCRLSADRIDVQDLDETVPGYRVDRAGTSGRGAIDPLRQYGYFDCVDSDVLRFPTRGKAIVATLDEDTLGAHEPGQQAPEMVTPNRVEDVELPRKVLVRYPMPHADYNVGAQESPRQVSRGVSTAQVDVPIAMGDDKAKQMSDVLLGEVWIGRETYKLPITPRWLGLEAADAIEIPIGAETQRAVITSITGGFPGVLQAEAKRDDQSIYISTAAGVASGIRPQELGIAGLTLFAMIDGPAFDDGEDDAGFYVAAYGTGTRWRGASLYESTDAGANYSRVLSVANASTMGTIDEALPAGPWQIWDEVNTLTVTLGAGTLESRTTVAVLNGANAAFVGAPGRWELIQFRTATLVAPGQYDLSGLLRGRRGTEWAIGYSQAGDTFVLCSTLSRVTKSSSSIGQARLYKMVTSRTLIEAAEAEAFSAAGVALECYAPAHVTASRDAGGDITFHVTRRARLGPEWIDYADVPLHEDSERYSIDILDGADVVRVIESSTPDVLYSAADQTDDFGAPQSSVDVVAYQLSATVGRGYSTEATV